MIKKIAYENKVAIQNDEEIARKNKVTDADLNEIKEVVNNNADELTGLKQQTEQAVEEINTDIENIKQEQTEQNTNIQKNTTDILNLNTNKASKAELQEATIALQAELLKAQEEIERQNKDYEAGTLEGQDTGESLYLQDSSDARFREFGIGGNSKQETREESNLYDKSTNITSKSINVSGEEVVSAGWAVTDYIAISAKNKLLKYNGLTAVGNNPHSAFYDSDKNFISSFKQATGENTIEIPENASYVRFTIEIVSGDINTFNVSYVAMPSLQFPSEVKTVGQDVNIFDKDDVNVIENAFINSETMSIATVAGRRCFYFPCEPNQEYSVLRKKVGQAFALGTTAGLPQLGSAIVDINIKNDEFETIKTSSNANYLVVYYKEKAAEEVDEDILNNIKIVKGTKINGYSPHGCGSANVTVCNKSVLPIQLEETQTANGITVINNKGRLTINGTSTAGFQFDIAKNFYLPKNNSIFNPNEISGTVTNTEEGVFPTYSMRNADNVQLITGMANRVGKNIPKTISASLLGNIMKFCTLWIPKNTVFNNFVIEPQIEAGNTATDYIEHEEQTLTISVQQEMLEGDCFEKVNGVCKEKHNWRKIILNGTESCIATADSPNRFLFDRIHNFTPIDHTRQKCTHSGLNKAWGTTDKSFDVRDNRGAYINIPNVTVEELKAKLAEDYANGTPLTFYFEVEPYYLDCTAEQIAILNEIEKTLHSYKGGTHVYSVDEISPIFNVKYTKDLNAVINNLSQQAIEGGN